MIAMRLPVSGIDIVIRPLSGREEMLLADAQTYDIALAVELLALITLRGGGDQQDWAKIPVPDIQAVLLHLRSFTVGERVQADVFCRNPVCGSRIDISFLICSYIAHHKPKRPKGTAPSEEPGWYVICGTPALFRIPLPADVITAYRAQNPAKSLLDSCIRPIDMPSHLRRRVMRAMSAIAPSLAQEVEGVCPDC